MAWILKGDRPIYLQLMDHIKQCIVTGQYSVGEKLPTVRELASQAAVNPNTMQKAFSELEREGLVFSQRTSGRFITEDEGLIAKMKEDLAKEHLTVFLKSMTEIGYNKEEILRLLEKAAGEVEQ